MAKVAVVFPGQGSQKVGMALDFYNQFETAKNLMDKANELLDIDLLKLMFEGPIEELTLTENAQPAIVAASVAILEVLREKGFDFQGAAGHSLGEYCAYVAAGKMDMEEAVKLVRKRGELMANADPEQKGGMAAVMRMDAAQVEEICDKYNEVVPANYNCPGQIVISGDKAQIDLAAEEIKNAKGRVMPLQVSGPFHSPLMREAALEFSKELEKVSFDASRVPVYANVDAKPVQHGEEKESLTRQIYSSVKWTQTIENMIKDGFDTFVEVGPGKVLQGLIKKINRDVKIIAVTEVTDLEKMEI